MSQAEVDAEQFRRAEASCLLEGVDVSSNPYYQKMKSSVLAGEMGIDAAIEQTVEHYKSLATTRVPEFSAAE